MKKRLIADTQRFAHRPDAAHRSITFFNNGVRSQR